MIEDMELAFSIPSYMVWTLIIIGGIMAWSIIGAIVAGLLVRFGYEGDDEIFPDPRIAGAIFPITCVYLLTVLICWISYWTIFLPARMVYKVISGDRY